MTPAPGIARPAPAEMSPGAPPAGSSGTTGERRPPALTAFPLAGAILERFAGALGPDYAGYAGHVARVLAFYRALAPDRQAPEQVQVAGAFHDLGIWTARTFDYLAPSVSLAREYLSAEGREAWTPEVETIILQHHKLTPYTGPLRMTVETFRRADLTDLSLGLFRSRLAERRSSRMDAEEFDRKSDDGLEDVMQ